MIPDPPGWFAQAACANADPETFFPEKGGTCRPAQRICAACPVADLCLDYAVSLPGRVLGVWAGRNERDLARLRRGRDVA